MADSITVTVVSETASLAIAVHFDAFARSAMVERSADGGRTWDTVRGGAPVLLIGDGQEDHDPGGDAFLCDMEAPLDVPLTYRATSNDGTNPTTGTPYPARTVETVSTTTIPSDGWVWLKDPSRPWASIPSDFRTDIRGCMTGGTPVTLTQLGKETFAADATTTGILNRPQPADVYARRKDATTSAQWLSRTLGAYQDMRVLLDAGGVLLLQFPAVYGWPDRYYQVDGVDASRISIDMRRPQRLWDTPLTVVLRPSPASAGQGTPGNTWCDFSSQYATYGDVAGSGLTWGQVVQNIPPVPTGGYGADGYGDGPYGGQTP